MESEYHNAMMRLGDPQDRGPIIYNCLINNVLPFGKLHNIINALSQDRRYESVEIEHESFNDVYGDLIQLYYTVDRWITIKFRLAGRQRVEPMPQPEPLHEPVRMRSVYMVLALPNIDDIVRQINLLSRGHYVAFDVIHESALRNESRNMMTHGFRTSDHVVTVIYNVLDDPNYNDNVGVNNVPNGSTDSSDAQ
jgi:hypothetical protein